MNVYDFLNELSIHFPMKEENKKHIFNKYADLILFEVHKLKGQYDYEKLLNSILTEYSFKTFPPIALIIRLIPEGIVKESLLVAKEGEIVVMITPDNRIYNFVVSGYGSSILDTKNHLKEKYGGVIIYQFPKGSTVLKDRVLIPNSDDTFTTKILEYEETA